MSSLVPRSALARALDEDAAHRMRMLVAQCEGFRVWTAGRKLGVVEKVVVQEWDEPRELVVCTGVFRLRRVAVPVDAVTMVDLRRRRVFTNESSGGRSPIGLARLDPSRDGGPA
jgi:hypothetical protein